MAAVTTAIPQRLAVRTPIIPTILQVSWHVDRGTRNFRVSLLLLGDKRVASRFKLKTFGIVFSGHMFLGHQPYAQIFHGYDSVPKRSLTCNPSFVSERLHWTYRGSSSRRQNGEGHIECHRCNKSQSGAPGVEDER